MTTYIIPTAVNGTITVQANQINTSQTSLKLIGRGVTSYGSAVAENTILQLSNFANSTAPASPLIGQIWYDSIFQGLKIYVSKSVGWSSIASSNTVDDVYLTKSELFGSNFTTKSPVLISKGGTGLTTIGASGQFLVSNGAKLNWMDPIAAIPWGLLDGAKLAIGAIPSNRVDGRGLSLKDANGNIILDDSHNLAYSRITGGPPANATFGADWSSNVVGSDDVNTSISTKSPTDSPLFTGNPRAPTVVATNNSTSIATTAYVTSGLSLKANINSPAFNGSITSTGGVFAVYTELGPTAYASTPYIDFHSSGKVIDYDSRIIASGGNGTAGTGTIAIEASAVTIPNLAVSIPMQSALNLKANLTANNFQAQQIVTVAGQTTYNTAGLQVASDTGDVHIGLHAKGQTATSIKHVRGGEGISIVGTDGITLGPIYARTAAPNTNNTEVATTAFVASSSGFAAGTKMLFVQSSAPTGWTRVTDDTANNRMLRVVTSGGGGGGGAHSPIINNLVPSHTHGFTTGTVSSDHNHGVADPGHAHNYVDTYYRENSSYGGNGGNYGVGSHSTDYDNSDFNYSRGTSTGWTGVSTYGISANHTHSGGTDNGSSQTNWEPRYLDIIICTKN